MLGHGRRCSRLPILSLRPGVPAAGFSIPVSLCPVSDDRLARLRIEYADEGLDEAAAGSDPTVLFLQWLDEAIASGMHEPNAMTLSTLGIGGAPSARIVLLKHADPSGLVFYTNYLSRKSREIGANPHCALTFPWHPLERQLRVEGTASQVPPEESDGYFALRPRAAQLGAVYLTGGSSSLRSFQGALGESFAGVPLVEGDLFGGVASGLAYATRRS